MGEWGLLVLLVLAAIAGYIGGSVGAEVGGTGGAILFGIMAFFGSLVLSGYAMSANDVGLEDIGEWLSFALLALVVIAVLAAIVMLWGK